VAVTVAGVEAEKVDEVVVDIDYEIIEHFSQNLYGSPNKAVEELVANGYDALATAVYAYVPGAQVGQRVVVWDDGTSMDIAGLKELWRIAHSPKAGGVRQVSSDRVSARAVIGKFGIGKLASYQVGQRITHLCRQDDRFLLVSLDYREIRKSLGREEPTPDEAQPVHPQVNSAPTGAADAPGQGPEDAAAGSDGDDAGGTQEAGAQAGGDRAAALPGGDDAVRAGEAPRYRAPIVELDEAAARAWAGEQFLGPADAFDQVWGRPSWTLAVVDELKDISLPPGRLRWVLGNGMPLRPDFTVHLDDVAVESKLGRNAEVLWQLDEARIVSELTAEWTDARDHGRVSGDIQTGVAVNNPDAEERPTIRFPQLGDVSAEVSLFATSLATGVAAEHGRSHGFFVMVRDRLLNPDDAKLLLGDPSFGTFYRTQFVLHVDGLDADLLANREQLRTTPRTAELAVLQKALYLAARKELDRRDADREIKHRSESLLPVSDTAHFREPLSALLVKQASSGETGAGLDLSAPRIERQTLEIDQPLAVLASDGTGFKVNDAHPFFAALRDRLGGGKKAKEALRAFDLIAVSEKLLEGHLFDTGLNGDEVDAVLAWRDGLFRALAEGYEGAPEDIVATAIDMSFVGDDQFEIALAELLRQMGFEATRDGASGEKDILVIAPTGPGAQRFTIEAKGSQGEITNEKAVAAAAAGHRKKVEASHAVIVAREFSGFKNKAWPAILQECDAVGGVSIADLDTIVELYRAVRRFFYPLEMLLPVLEVLEKPADKLARIHSLAHPTDSFDFAELLGEIWKRQGAQAMGDPVPFRSVHQDIWKERGIEWDEFKLRLTALVTLSRGLMNIKKSANEVFLLQHPDIIAEAIRESLGAE
jgi:hypothetical protein